MRKSAKISVCCCAALWGAGVGCERQLPFADYQREFFAVTPITAATEEVIKFANPHPDAPQHLRAVAFDPGGNPGGHFELVAVTVGGQEVGQHDISVPPGGVVGLRVRYRPRDLEETTASFGGWETGMPTRNVPRPPEEEPRPGSGEGAEAPRLSANATAVKVAAWLAGASPPVVSRPDGPDGAGPEVLHRALLDLTYDLPREGVTQLEVVGYAIPGPEGETTATGGGGDEGTTGGGECTAGGMVACFTGSFSIELPGLMQSAVETELSGPVPITIAEGAVTMQMAQFPVALFVVTGNGPGEPLEGQPLAALSIAITGDAASVASGTFDGSQFNAEQAGFRVRIYFAEMSLEAIGTTVAPVDFRLTGLTITTVESFQGGEITLGVDTVLGENPSGNPLADPLLSGATVIVRMHGTLALP